MSRSSQWLRLLVSAVLLCLPGPAHAASPPRVSGMVFADVQDQLHGTAIARDSSSFRFRRVQVTFDQDLDTTFAMRVQLEADETELTSRGRDAVFLKQVWLRWARLGGWGDLTMGMSGTPTWSVAEGVWGYRSIERTVLDLQGFGTATDMGVALQRAPSDARALGYHLMLSNGAGPRPENTAGKKLMLSLPYRRGAMTYELMGDYEDERGTLDRWTAKALVGWQHADDAVGLEVFRRVNQDAGPAGSNMVPAGVSVYARHALNPRWRAIARLDAVDPDTEHANAGYRELYAIVALDAQPMPNVHLMPNVLMRTYDAKSNSLPDRDADITLRVTLAWNYR